MAYVADNLALMYQSVGAQSQRYFVYSTASDSDATIVGTGYFANGIAAGMRVGDMVEVVATTGPKYKKYQVTAVNTTTGSATVSAPTAIT